MEQIETRNAVPQLIGELHLRRPKLADCRPATAEEITKIRATACAPDYYAMLGLKFSLWSSDSQTSELFKHIYRKFLISTTESVDYDFLFLARNNGQEPVLLANDQLYVLNPSYLSNNGVHSLVLDTLIERITDYFIFHGAAVCRDNQGIIIVGPAGAGKTTLSLELVQEGYEFLSDELSPVCRQSLKLHPFPLSLGLRRGALQLFPNLKAHPLWHNLRRNLNATQAEKWFLDADYIKPRTTPCELRAIYFLNPGSPSQYCSSLINQGCSSPINWGTTVREKDRENRKEDRLVDMALYQEEPKFAAALCSLPGIELVNLQHLDGYAVYRFRVERKSHGLTRFLRACQPFKESIFYREEASQYEPDFSRKKNLVPLDKPGAALEMLKHLRNRTSRSRLRREFPHLAQLMMEMGRVVEGVECWQFM